MGIFMKSMLIIAIAISTPIIYRQFATDNTIKFMSTYYSNYKMIDTYLKQSANRIDQAKEHLPDAKQLQHVYEKLKKQFNQFLDPVSTTSSKKSDVLRSSNEKPSSESKTGRAHRLTSCPGEQVQVRLWSKDELSEFDGNSGSPDVYLAFLGVVYNVTINAQHYGPGADYNAFAGHDATRAFVTGNFTHDLHDDIRDIDEQMYSHFGTWASFYSTSYPTLGRIEGAFFDSRGCATPELIRVQGVFDKLAQDKANQSELDKSLPECNSEWNGDLKKGRVWCSTKSGGVERNWVGVPRIHDSGSKRCVCLNLESPDAAQQAKSLGLYPGCDARAIECTLQE